MEQIPKWIIDYDKCNYQSSAGKAIRILLQEIESMQLKIVVKDDMIAEMQSTWINPSESNS